MVVLVVMVVVMVRRENESRDSEKEIIYSNDGVVMVMAVRK